MATIGVCAVGAGRAAATPVITPAEHNFGSAAVTSSSAPVAFTLRHACLPNVMFPTMCMFEPPYAADPRATGDFAVSSHNCPASLPGPVVIGVEPSCTINAVFRPTAEGARSGQLQGNSTGFPNANLSGTGTPAPPTPAPPKKKKKCKKKKRAAGSAAKKKCKKKKK
jgi:hypothetical protein